LGWQNSQRNAYISTASLSRAASVPEVVAMTISGHADANVFKRYNVRRDEVQADALAKQTAYLAQQRDTTRRPAPLPRAGGQ